MDNSPSSTTSTTPPPLNQEEFSSLRNAMAVMLLVSAIVLITTLLGIRLFAFEFYLAIVYSPTILLVLAWIVLRARRMRA